MLVEKDTDGYHANSVHASFISGVALQGRYGQVFVDM